MALALALNQSTTGRGMLRAAAILPWALPTVVVALLWRFAFEGSQDIASLALMRLRIVDGPVLWFAGAVTAWVPIITADVWRMTPFVALLLLAGLQQIDPALYEAARMDGAGRWRQFRAITLPLLVPALLVATLFRGARRDSRLRSRVRAHRRRARHRHRAALAVGLLGDDAPSPLRLRLRRLDDDVHGRLRGRAGLDQADWHQPPRTGAGMTRQRLANALDGRRRAADRAGSAGRRADGVADARRPAVRYPGPAGGAAHDRPLPRALRRAGILDPDSQLADRRHRDDRAGARARHTLCLRAGSLAVPRPGRGARADPGDVDVPADRDRAVVVPAAARDRIDRHLPRAGPAVPDVCDAARGVVPGHRLPATAGRDRRGRHDGRRLAVSPCSVASPCRWRRPAWRRPGC